MTSCITFYRYFGSFDPIHENHIALVLHSLRKQKETAATAAMDKVFLVPNENNPRKPFVAPVYDRRQLIRARLDVRLTTTKVHL